MDNATREIVEKGKSFIFGHYEIHSLEDIVSFEQQYVDLCSQLSFCFNDEWYDFTEGNLDYLSNQPFKRAKEIYITRNNSVNRLLSFGLDEIEFAVINSFLAQASAIYRLDGYDYDYGIPPIVEILNRYLQSALNKLPVYEGDIIVRQYNEHDQHDFEIGQLFQPNYSLTASANPAWNDGSWNQYIIHLLPSDRTKAKSLTFVNNQEQQVTFLMGASFKIKEVIEGKDNQKRITMDEI